MGELLTKLGAGEGFDIWITLKKFVTGFVYMLVPLLLSYSIEFVETETFPVEYAVYVSIIGALLHALSNLWKHWHDEEE